MKFMLDKEKLEMIQTATEDEISDMILAVQQRFHELHQDWSMHVCVIENNRTRNEQIDLIIAHLEGLKEK